MPLFILDVELIPPDIGWCWSPGTLTINNFFFPPASVTGFDHMIRYKKVNIQHVWIWCINKQSLWCQLIADTYHQFRGRRVVSLFNSVLLGLGPVSQRVAINRTMDVNHSTMIYRVLRKLVINLLETSPECTRAGVYGKCVLKQNQIVFNGLITTLCETRPWREFPL